MHLDHEPSQRGGESADPSPFSEFVYRSSIMRETLSRLAVVAGSRRTTLLIGPTGVGKDVAARALHRAGQRGDVPYVPVLCGALPDTLFEAELFGHTRGAFTGASQARQGLVKSAANGTLFLDEIDALSTSAQAKLLRLLETREYRAVGSDRVEKANAWIIAATNRDLHDAVERGTFREDLFYRLDVLRVELPALRERPEDVEILAEKFLKDVSPNGLRFSPACTRAMNEYEWPGNVRELKHRIERAALFHHDVLEPEDLGLSRAVSSRGAAAQSFDDLLWSLVSDRGMSLGEAVEHCEQSLIHAALRAEQENRSRAAQRLGVHVRTIFKKLRR